MHRAYCKFVNSPLGSVSLFATDKGLILVKIGAELNTISGGTLASDIKFAGENDVLKLAEVELNEYFEGRRKYFTVNLDISGSEFDMDVWDAAKSIPYGETRSYCWLSEQIGRPKAYRAVGGALSRNPTPIFIPCHRVIRSDGGLGGYSAGLRVKRLLLKFEKEGKLDPNDL
ncbi:MAG: methylated-DNA--[protein]-cysteine S-methyltransferase [Nitrososphaerales archaeon]